MDVMTNNIMEEIYQSAAETASTQEEECPELVPEKAIHLYTNSWNEKVYVARCSDRKRVAYFFYMVFPSGEVADPIAKARTKLMGANGFDFLMDMEGDFDKADVDAIRAQFNAVSPQMEAVQVDTKTPMSEIYSTLCQKVKALAREVKAGPDNRGPFKARVLDEVDGRIYGNIPVETFTELVKDRVEGEEWFKWTPLSIKQELKRLGKLRTNANRYDLFHPATEERQQCRVISIKLPEGWWPDDD